MKAIIVDDEKHSRDNLAALLNRYCSAIELVGLASSVETGLLLIEKHEPEVVFLDIQMPEADGFTLLNTHSGHNFKVVFTTAYEQYALQAIKHGAIDYLLKPIDVNELINTAAKLSEQHSQNKSPNANQPPEAIALPSLEGLEIVEWQDIVWCESDGNYSKVFFSDNSFLMICRSLKELEEVLSPYPIFRIHHSFLINIKNVKKYLKGKGGQVVMSTGKTLDVSVRRKADFLNQFNRV